MKLLFVCHGNKERSAAAELIARARYPQFEVQSSGVAARTGSITSRKMRQALAEAGYPAVSMRSQPTTQAQIDWADLVLYMDSGNQRRLQDRFGDIPHAQRLSDYVEGAKSIPNPGWCKDMRQHRKIVLQIEEALARLASTN
jgi:protein-tyrosine-phosphatase